MTDVHELDGRQLEAEIRRRAAELLDEVREWGSPGPDTSKEYGERLYLLRELLGAVKVVPLTIDLAHRMHTEARFHILQDVTAGMACQPAIDLYAALYPYIGDDRAAQDWRAGWQPQQ